jgi:tRNA-splicing ligase RtcB (3'-phosphate/5'-hydroxy nucleic acid ligase)
VEQEEEMKAVLSSNKFPVKLWIPVENVESSALDQIRNLANLPFNFKHVAIMPDVHTGVGATVGSVIASRDTVIPSSVGVDIGCGMMAIRTPFNVDEVRKALPDIKHSIERSIPTGFHQHQEVLRTTEEWVGTWELYNMLSFDGKDKLRGKARLQMGTLGGGNHFIEISTDENNDVWIILHSGSRNIGKCIAECHIGRAKELMQAWHVKLDDPNLAYLPLSEQAGKNYMSDADWAQDYAMKNRQAMMQLISKDLSHILNHRADWNRLEEINCHHNYVEQENHFGTNVWVTRKGAIRAREGELAVIPGSMGTESYIVKGLGNPDSFCSASHGAGRRMSRKQAKNQFTMEDFDRQMEGILCTRSEGVLDEIPSAYKDISEVMANQEDLVQPIHTLHQMLCIKGDKE